MKPANCARGSVRAAGALHRSEIDEAVIDRAGPLGDNPVFTRLLEIAPLRTGDLGVRVNFVRTAALACFLVRVNVRKPCSPLDSC